MTKSHLHAGEDRHEVAAHFAPRSTLLGKVYSAPSSELLFVPLFGVTRPPERLMLAIRQSDGTRFFPGVDAGDYRLVAQHMGLSAIDDIVLYWLVSQGDFAVIERDVVPVRLRSIADAARRGIPAEAEEFEKQNVSIWWQEWGGMLMSCEHDPQSGLVVRSELLRQGVGPCRRLPTSIVR